MSKKLKKQNAKLADRIAKINAEKKAQKAQKRKDAGAPAVRDIEDIKPYKTDPVDKTPVATERVSVGTPAETGATIEGTIGQPVAAAVQAAMTGKPLMSGLDAAAKVLAEAGTSLNCPAIIKAAFEKGYWSSGGKTPAATIHTAIITEIKKRGEGSRFVKTGRGLFAVRVSA